MHRNLVTGLMAAAIVVLAGAMAQAQERVRIDVSDDRLDAAALVEQLDKAIGYGSTRSLSQQGASRVSLMLPVEFTFGSAGLTKGAA
jgi:hypothetical protein